MPPHKARGPARSRNTVDVSVKQVVAVRDDGEVLMARLDVGRASGTGGALESHLVVVDFIVARLVYRAAVSPSLVIAALVYHMIPHLLGLTVSVLPYTSTSCDAAMRMSGPPNQPLSAMPLWRTTLLRMTALNEIS